jgi:hypothetical protein
MYDFYDKLKSSKSKVEPKVKIKVEEKVDMPDIKLSLDTYKSDLEKFDKYCSENNLNKKEFLYKIQTEKLNVHKDDLMYF